MINAKPIPTYSTTQSLVRDPLGKLSVSVRPRIFHMTTPLTWKTGTHSYKANSGDGILKAYRTAEVRTDVTDDGRQHADEHDRRPEAEPPVAEL